MRVQVLKYKGYTFKVGEKYSYRSDAPDYQRVFTIKELDDAGGGAYVDNYVFLEWVNSPGAEPSRSWFAREAFIAAFQLREPKIKRNLPAWF